MFDHIGTFYKLVSYADETAEKTENNFDYKCVLELHFSTIKGPGRTKLLKSLHPNVEEDYYDAAPADK